MKKVNPEIFIDIDIVNGDNVAFVNLCVISINGGEIGFPLISLKNVVERGECRKWGNWIELCLASFSIQRRYGNDVKAREFVNDLVNSVIVRTFEPEI